MEERSGSGLEPTPDFDEAGRVVPIGHYRLLVNRPSWTAAAYTRQKYPQRKNGDGFEAVSVLLSTEVHGQAWLMDDVGAGDHCAEVRSASPAQRMDAPEADKAAASVQSH